MSSRSEKAAGSRSNGKWAVTRTCHVCGAPARLFGIEPHPVKDRVELQTYVCTRCEALETEAVPLRDAPAA